MDGVGTSLEPLPSPLRRTITFDRGTEFAFYSKLRSRLGMESYFCKPQAPWQKGTVENTNGRIRRYLPSEPLGFSYSMPIKTQRGKSRSFAT
jgi:IS30 family transposase